MVLTVASILLMALTRAELIARLKAPVITQCEGLVKVFADCPEDMRREYQMPIASFASETVKAMYRGEPKGRMRKFARAGIVIHVGETRTNDTSVVTRVSTNEAQVVSRIYLPAPGAADVGRFRLEVVKAFCRSVKGLELDDAAADEAFRATDPRYRIESARNELERWLAGEKGTHDRRDCEYYLQLMRKVIEPGQASRRDVLVFASRLYLYPVTFSRPFFGRLPYVDFRTAAKHAAQDPHVRLAAAQKANEMVIFGGGRGEDLSAASLLYARFLQELAAGKLEADVLLEILEAADVRLNVAFENAVKSEQSKGRL